MPADPQTVERLVEMVTRRVLLALAEEEQHAAHPAADLCTQECGSGYCVRHCGDRVELIVQAGADRVASGLGVTPARASLASMIDHTLLRPDATADQIAQLCYEARKYGFAAVCINPTHVALAAQLLRGSSVAVCTVVGFPLGATPPEVKAYEAQVALGNGATEIDMVINIGALKSGLVEAVEADIRGVADASHRGGAICKVILETSLLNTEEKVRGSLAAKNAGADFVKTSTGFSTGGATAEDVRLMRAVVGDGLGVKASGGVRSLEDVQKMVQAGATRIGASASVKILEQARTSLPAEAAANMAPSGNY